MSVDPPAPGSLWRAMLALLASLALHLAILAVLALFQVDYLERRESQPLVARIAPLAPVAAPKTETVAEAAPTRPRRQARSSPQAATAASLTPVPAEPVAQVGEAKAAAAEAQVTALPANPQAVVSSAPAEPPAAPPIPFPERIELEFDVAKAVNDVPMGHVVHRFERDGKRYMIQSVTAATGIAALFATGRYVQESRGILTPQGLQPEQFMVRRGRAERTESAAFDWAGLRATHSAGGATSESSLQAGAQDQLSYLHQLSFLIADPSLPPVTVSNGRRFRRVKLEILGWETVATGLGSISALHVRGQLEGESRIDYWLAPDYGNLPVKVRFRDQRGDELDQVLTAVKVK